MSTLEICLIIIGIICIVVSFIFIPKEEKSENTTEATLSKEQMENLTKKIDTMITEQISDVEEKTEITMEKISTRKIMEISEYSDTVIAQINKNHEEAMFLYDMLNEKGKEVKKLSSEMAQNKPKTTRTKKATEESPEKPVEKVADKEATQEAKSARKPRTTKAKANISNNNEKILSLHNEGRSIVEIAKALGLGIGEVKLVVDLFKGES